MTCEEHYFENLLYYGKDIKGNPNKNAISKEKQRAVEICADYVIYTLFINRDNFNKFLAKEENLVKL